MKKLRDKLVTCKDDEEKDFAENQRDLCDRMFFSARDICENSSGDMDKCMEQKIKEVDRCQKAQDKRKNPFRLNVKKAKCKKLYITGRR